MSSPTSLTATRDLFQVSRFIDDPPIDHFCPFALLNATSDTIIRLILTFCANSNRQTAEFCFWNVQSDGVIINWKTFVASIRIGPYYKMSLSISVNLSFSVPFISAPSVPIKSGSKNSHWTKNHVHILHLDPSLRVSKWSCRPFWCHQSGSRDEYSAPSPVHITTTCFN